MGMVRTTWIFPACLLVMAAMGVSLRADDAVAPATNVASGNQAATAPATTAAATVGTQYWIGVGVESISPIFSHILGLKPGQGLLIRHTIHGGPAYQAGMQEGDLLIEVAGKPLFTGSDLMEAVQAKSEGAAGPLGFVLIRENKRLTINVTPALRPAEFVASGHNRIQLPNGAQLDVGPGYVVDPAGPIDVAIKQVASMPGGQAIVCSQSTDSLGNVRTTIAVGKVIYEVTPGTVASLPVELQPLARKMLPSSATAPGK